MKQANNNEVDLLLRSLARPRGESSLQGVATSGESVASEHLDADELNSYAEGVAPAPARARYMEHLADCDACRGIVVGLTQAAGAASRHDVAHQQGGFSVWQKLTALLSLPILRYAVPALVLTAVIGIGLFALKQQRQTDFVAQNQPRLAAPPAVQGDNGAAFNPTPGSPAAVQNGAKTGSNEETSKDNLKDQKTQAIEQPTLAPESSVAKTASKDAAQPGEAAGAIATQSYATEPKAAAPPPPAPLLDAEKSTVLAKEQPAKREDQPRDRDEAFRVAQDDVHGPNRARNNVALPANGRSAGSMTERGSSGADKKKAAEVETRTVMGRHFTREGGAWVDNAYDSSRATIRVTRGSEQFRALVADEPGMRTIAEQLGGVVIVVWKGRAYRIQ
ncbi:MAG: zf-HC2 domain-containing protein [bacterium]